MVELSSMKINSSENN